MLIQGSDQPYGGNSESVNGVVDTERYDYGQQIEGYVAHGATSAFSAPALLSIVLANATIEGRNLSHRMHHLEMHWQNREIGTSETCGSFSRLTEQPSRSDNFQPST